jgi:hypothetical protein
MSVKPIPMKPLPHNGAQGPTGSARDSPSAAPESGDRHLELLRTIAEQGGMLRPKPDPHAPNGHRLDGLPEGAERELDYLVRRDYLEERFFERVSLCPTCGSHHLNIRETCTSCGSANIRSERLLHHYRCGFVGPESAFRGHDGDRVCPKCDVPLEHVGTDHDPIGRSTICGACGASIHEPAATASCIACGATTDAGSLASIDLGSYHLTGLGTAAIRRGTLFEDAGDPLFVPDLPVYRAHVFHQLLENEAKRLPRSSGVFTLCAIECGAGAITLGDDAAAIAAVRALAAELRETDVIGLLDDRTMAVLMPATDLAGGERTFRRVREASAALARFVARGRLVEIRKPADLDALSLAPGA